MNDKLYYVSNRSSTMFCDRVNHWIRQHGKLKYEGKCNCEIHYMEKCK